jgi:hypothetical protein
MISILSCVRMKLVDYSDAAATAAKTSKYEQQHAGAVSHHHLCSLEGVLQRNFASKTF